MGKSESKRAAKASAQSKEAKSFIPIDKKAIDSNLSSLFASSAGPVKPPPKSRYQDLPAKRSAPEAKDDDEEDEDEEMGEEEDDEELSSVDGDIYGDEEDEEDASTSNSEEGSEEDEDVEDDSPADNETALAKVREAVLSQEQPNKKRKRKEEEVEDVYMRKLAREEVKEEEKRKKQKTAAAATKKETMGEGDASDSEESEEDTQTIPKHETQVEGAENPDEVEKAARTVFLGNVSSEAITSKSAKKTLLRHLASFIEDMPDHDPPHKVESLRFRSTAFATVLPKKAAYAKKEVLDATTKSTNAYAVYSTQQAALQAAKRLNGTTVLNRHLRVDSLAHPAQTDHRRCVFVGNLGFVDDESSTATPEDGKKQKPKPPSDVEEGLWVHFSKAGKVESVRVVRDAKTRVGKGFAYVQFYDENAVEAALQCNDQKFPPLLPRKLRVVRAKAQKKRDKKPEREVRGPKGSVYNAKVTEEQKTHQGRARAMLGKAARSADFVFEGHRATAKQGHSGLKLGGKGKKKGKPSNRSTRRAAAWASAGGKAQFNKK